MKTKKEFPPNYKEITERFPFVKDHKGVIFTYGDTCYMPYADTQLPNHLEVHESTHTEQQGKDPASWWEKYLSDDTFRFEQEVEAYGKQYKFFSKNHGNGAKKKFLFHIARDLASPIYELSITYQEAENAIRRASK